MKNAYTRPPTYFHILYAINPDEKFHINPLSVVKLKTQLYNVTFILKLKLANGANCLAAILCHIIFNFELCV